MHACINCILAKSLVSPFANFNCLNFAQSFWIEGLKKSEVVLGKQKFTLSLL